MIDKVAVFGLLMMTTITASADTASPILPNASITPGVSDDKGTVKNVCTTGYSSSVRNVPQSLKNKVYKLYNLDKSKDKFEVDHLISLELGGSNDISNLWPQSYTTVPWNARVKDKLENKLHRMVCNGDIILDKAQEMISNDWIRSYCIIFDDMREECIKYGVKK